MHPGVKQARLTACLAVAGGRISCVSVQLATCESVWKKKISGQPTTA